MARRRGGRAVGAEALRGRIERWRKAGRPGKRMPEELWGAAVELAHDRGAYRIANELGLSYQALKQRTDEAGQSRRRSERGQRRRAEFVEIDIGRARPLEAHEVAVLLSGGDPRGVRGAEPWRRIGDRAA